MTEFKFGLCYSLRGLADLITTLSGQKMDRRKLQRLLKKGGVDPREDGKVWISDIKSNMDHFLDSMIELKHQRDMAVEREEERDEDLYEDYPRNRLGKKRSSKVPPL